MVAYLALGSNLGDRRATLHRAVRALAECFRVEAISAHYETVPEGGAAQPMYVNAVVRVETSASPHEVLRHCLRIEAELGRVRRLGERHAPRVIDIDVLLCGDLRVDDDELRLPHPAMLGRAFVRIPLADVAVQGLRHPLSGESLDHASPDAGVRRLDGATGPTYSASSPAGGSS